jgi:hypothetical protein
MWGWASRKQGTGGDVWVSFEPATELLDEASGKYRSAIIELGLEILCENREVGKVLSPEKNGKPAISLCGDARWDERSSGRNYSFLSGCSLVVGCRSQLAWDVEPMSNVCIKCVRNIEQDVETCAQHVTCSAKAMVKRLARPKLLPEFVSVVTASSVNLLGTTTPAPKR